MQEADKLELAAVIPVPCADMVTTPAVCHATGCGRSHRQCRLPESGPCLGF